MKVKKIFPIIIILLIFTIYLVKDTIASFPSNSIEIDEDTLITYYLEVKYDEVSSLNNEAYSKINDGYLMVYDRIPEGLEFDSFVTTYDGTIGAVKSSFNSNDVSSISYCSGNVLDDTFDTLVNSGTWNNEHTLYTYHGLYYDATTGIVSFKVENLEAGCQVNVGIKVKPKSLDSSVTRADYYNYATVRDNAKTVYSNLLHHFIGNDNSNVYEVRYHFSEEVVDAPALPPSLNYQEGSLVGLAAPIYALGYRFDGWVIDGVEVDNNSFVMPNHDVDVYGSFTLVNPHQVSYTIDGVVPSGYEVPSTKNYYSFISVSLAPFQTGQVYNGYKFLGWSSDDVSVSSDGKFIMPDSDVTFTGRFVPEVYTVTYKFYDKNLPINADNLLPSPQTYSPGEVINFPKINDTEDKIFVGWNKPSNYKMPNSDIDVYGTWRSFDGYYEPSISMSLDSMYDGVEYFMPGDVVKFNYVISNNITDDVYLGLKTDLQDSSLFDNNTNDNNIKFYKLGNNDISSNYVSGEGYFKIPDDANGSVDVSSDIVFSYSSNSGYKMALKSYKVTDTIKIVPKVKICSSIDNISDNNIINKVFRITNDDGFETEISLNRDCVYVYLYPGTYYINQVLPMGLSIFDVDGIFNNSSFVVSDDDLVITFNNSYNGANVLKTMGGSIFNISPDTYISGNSG